MNGSFLQALHTQGRVLWALSLRELGDMRGKSRLGYLWNIIKTGFGLAVFWALRAATGMHTPGNLPMPVFLLLGFITWFMFEGTLSKIMVAVQSNRSLLSFSRVQTLDLALSGALVNIGTELIIMLLYFCVFRYAGYSLQLLNIPGFIVVMLSLAAFSIGIGLILASLAAYVPAVEQLMPIVLRILFLTSGIFFSVRGTMRGPMAELLLLNPIMIHIELTRSCFSSLALPREFHPEIFFCVSAVMLALGFLMERGTRNKVLSS